MKYSFNVESGVGFATFLKKLTFAGIISEVEIRAQGDCLAAACVDDPQLAFSMCYLPIDSEIEDEVPMRFGEIPKLLKYLSGDKRAFTITLDDEAGTFKVIRQSRKGELIFSMLEVNQVPSVAGNLIDEDSLSNYQTVVVGSDDIADLISYLDATECSCFITKITKKRLWVQSESGKSTGFSTKLNKLKSETAYQNTYPSQRIKSVLALIGSSDITFYLAEDEPLIMEQDGNYWGFALHAERGE